MAKVLERQRAEKFSDEEQQAGSPENAAGQRSFFKRPVILGLSAIVIIVGLIFGIRYFLYVRSHETTDDAFIEGQVTQISPKVTGHVLKIYVQDNQQVKPGDLLLELDARDYEAKLDQAKAALQAAEARERAARATVNLTRASTRGTVQQASSGVSAAKYGVDTARTQVAIARERAQQAQAAIATAQANAQQAQAQIAAAEAESNRANADVQRYRQLYEKDEVSRQQLDQVVAASQLASAQLNAARERAAASQAQVNEARAAAAAITANIRQAETQVNQAQAQVGEASGRYTEAAAAPQQIHVSEAQAGTASAEIQQARAAVEQAELQLSYTKVYAPIAGKVTRKAIDTGSFVQIGQALMAIVPSDLWVLANFKETQLDQIRPGQSVEIKIDAFPGKVFKGHIDSIQRGTGSRFSMIPPENATGNYVKVVQRVPVKIVFDEAPDAKYPLGPGMSVEPQVQVK